MSYAQGNNQSLSNFLGSSNPEPVSRPVMEQSLQQLHASLENLRASAEWLVQKIQPICQPQPAVQNSVGEKLREVEAPPSNIRAGILEAKAKADQISQTLDSVRFLIEV